jgi:hypothetical protein
MASCAGAACPATVFHTAAAPAHYPLRLDTSLREQGATLTPVRVVRIR